MPTVLFGEFEEPLVQRSGDTMATQGRVDPDEVDVSLVGSGLGQESDEEGHQPAIVIFDDITTRGEVLEEQPGQQRRAPQ